MSNYLVHGKLGTGKGKFTVSKMQLAIKNGLRVATNVDLKLEHLVSSQNKCCSIRLPDKPTGKDLLAIGPGCADSDKYNEDKYGIMVLDELGSWLNARTHASTDRAAFIDWCIHARKHRWHVYFIAQDISMVDRQLRDGLVEYLVKTLRGDKVKIPVIGAMLGKMGKLKGLHIANTSMVDMPGFVVEREWFRGKDLHGAYDTLQIFRNWARDPSTDEFKTELFAGPHSMLSAWHLKGRHEAVEVVRPGFFAGLFAPVKVKVLPKPKTRIMQLIAQLPHHEAVYYANRLSNLGAL